jgi:hypothetical protein
MTRRTYASRRPGTRMSPAERVGLLLTERAVFGRPLVFTEAPRMGGRVHVVGPDEDQPAYTDTVDALTNRRVRTVCGFDIRRTALEGTHIGVFADRRICWNCHRWFGDRAPVIFEDNTPAVQDGADAGIRLARLCKGK